MKRFSKLFFIITIAISFLNAKGLSFNIQTVQGKTLKVTELKNGLDFKDYKGKIVLLEFWGTHCPPCLYSINKYKALLNEFKDKVAMVAIEVQLTPRDKLKEFANRAKMNYDVVAQDDARDFIRYVAQRAGWSGAIPFLIILDRDGEVLDIKRGFSPNEFEHIKKLIDLVYSKDSNKTNISDLNSSKKIAVANKKDNNSSK